MDDSELQAIRQARMAELQRSQGGASGIGASPGIGPGSEKDSARASQEEEQRVSVLAQILTPSARERLSRIRIVRMDRARGVEDLLIRMARSGQIQQKVDEPQLVSMLDQISRQEVKSRETKIIFDRRQTVEADDVEEEDDDDFFD
ncbi:DNA-binding TFAR19-related protein [Nadsonia fulvescens var. elongata DSM 6958]|uniref:DNA-binding TFAR19-related protein n=1 Tax=Nadsonia fulvescens var. elongata DSM 6958 TaxID=857566 RepID=A0A1E3PKK3_9ASCO|nr:DNA-binding TFAR19-related protein [Nadsonia fulvescens var. elongata DSM 6958]